MPLGLRSQGKLVDADANVAFLTICIGDGVIACDQGYLRSGRALMRGCSWQGQPNNYCLSLCDSMVGIL